ncbi:MAG: bifunctional aspartate kinase/homoserine dehydrogenase I [Saprospiraceae bacterium]|nr:bifunctional aspartate kinase/homoserine dehydrogenase I [Saprospiraceae bacterium]
MKVLKFGGTSVGTPAALRSVAQIIRAQSADHRLMVVVSALSGVTNALEALAASAVNGEDFSGYVSGIRARHLEMIEALDFDQPTVDQFREHIEEYCHDLNDICTGVKLVGELSPRSRARLMSAGELISSHIVTRMLQSVGVEAVRKDSRDFITTTGDPLNGMVRIEETYDKLRQLATSETAQVIVMPGFIARDEQGKASTLGRGGSDYTAALIAAAVKAEAIEIWTDVSGVMTANPQLVSKAHPVERMTYAEAMELSYFGAKVIYSPTIHPLIVEGIPLRIRNTLDPAAPGTLITANETDDNLPVKGISSIFDIALITVAGAGMIGVPGTAMRMFRAMAARALNILFITQSSSEQTITVGLREADADAARLALQEEFARDLERGQIDEILVEADLTLMAVVGEQMKNRPGIAGKIFGLMGENGINVRAIAQGSTERNVSFVISTRDASKALNTLHEGFFLSESRAVHLFNVGVGNVGSAVLQQIRDQHAHLLEAYGLDLKVAGLANSRKMIFDEEGLDLENWQDRLASGEPYSRDGFVKQIIELNLRTSIFVDNTASADVAVAYAPLLGESIHVVTSNKIGASSDMQHYAALKAAAVEHGVQYLYETNVAAGLPVIRTIRDMLLTGDRIHRIEAVLSGSLNYIFNRIGADCPFSQAVTEARELGLTEPDPAIDLSGLDVQRKILILAREAGYHFELSDVGRGHMIPPTLETGASWPDLLAYLQQHDADIEMQRRAVEEAGRQWRFMATLIDDKLSVGVLSVSPEHPGWVLGGKDNLVLLYSDRYHEQPLVVKGAGAGPHVTASGVLADILRIANV